MERLVAASAEEWSVACSNAFVSLATRVPSEFGGSIQHLDIADLRLARVDCRRSSVDRTQARIVADSRDDILVNIQLAGQAVGIQDDRVATAGPGAAMLCEASRVYALRFPAESTLLSLRVPRDRLPVRERALREMTARLFPTESLGTTVLRYFLESLLATPSGTAPTTDFEDLAETATELLRLALRPPSDPTDATGVSGHALYVAATIFMRLHMRDPALTVEVVARSQGVSRRTLELAFAERNRSPAEHLRRMRLAESRRLLSSPKVSETVTAVAHQAGFADVTTFIRAFRRTYGSTPDAWRREHAD